jgi:hypothetical protein
VITVNKNTTQNPSVAQGRTGQQSLRFIPAPRVYIAPPDYSPVPGTVFPLSNGSTPSAFTDLGVVTGNASVQITRATAPVFSGVDKIQTGVVSQGISGGVSFSLSQMDDFLLEQLSGTGPAYTSTGYANYQIGGQNLTPAALLLVVQNKLDGKEWQFYNPTALLSFSFDNQSDAMGLKVSGILPAYATSLGGPKSILSITIGALSLGFGYGVTPYGVAFGF